MLMAILEYGEEWDALEGGEDSLDEITAILEDTEWMNNLEEARRQRNRICELAGITPPQPKKK